MVSCYPHNMFWFDNKVRESDISGPFRLLLRALCCPVSYNLLPASTLTVFNEFCQVLTIIVTANIKSP